ncbi:hypothetical protein C8R44DRAFT_725079 [Mycena epipterygia]|nr:hypothetical protein C8R44DRAFT_725079 [Mycena epipterygia]
MTSFGTPGANTNIYSCLSLITRILVQDGTGGAGGGDQEAIKVAVLQWNTRRVNVVRRVINTLSSRLNATISGVGWFNNGIRLERAPVSTYTKSRRQWDMSREKAPSEAVPLMNVQPETAIKRLRAFTLLGNNFSIYRQKDETNPQDITEGVYRKSSSNILSISPELECLVRLLLEQGHGYP